MFVPLVLEKIYIPNFAQIEETRDESAVEHSWNQLHHS